MNPKKGADDGQRSETAASKTVDNISLTNWNTTQWIWEKLNNNQMVSQIR